MLDPLTPSSKSRIMPNQHGHSIKNLIAVGATILTVACQTTAPTKFATVEATQDLITQDEQSVTLTIALKPDSKTWISFGPETEPSRGVAWFRGDAPMVLTLTVQRSEPIRGHHMAKVAYQLGTPEGASVSGAFDYMAEAATPLNEQISLAEIPETLSRNGSYVIGDFFGNPLRLGVSDPTI